MCCLFGILDYGHNLTGKQRNRMISVLATACELRGTDATGISYNSSNDLRIFKRPIPAHKIKFRIPEDAHFIMGHTRMTTQGNEKYNYNNHPFPGMTNDGKFALAHNGVLRNDIELRAQEKLPETKIETDSYIAVQLIEQLKRLDFATLRYMAELLEGSFTITVMDTKDNLYFIKGDNPMCIYHYPELGFYIYASTEDILKEAIRRMLYRSIKPVKVDISCGDILKIDRNGIRSLSHFNTDRLLMYSYYPFFSYSRQFVLSEKAINNPFEDEYLDELKAVASKFGYSGQYIDFLLDEGLTTDDIEEIIYCGEFV